MRIFVPLARTFQEQDSPGAIMANLTIISLPDYATGMTETSFEVPTGVGTIVGSQSGAGPALLMLHGGPGFTDYMQILSPEVTGWHALHYQQRGLRPSSVDGPATVDQHVADAVTVLDARQVARAVVLGHSWGGHLAMHLAVSHPGRVAGLVLVDPLGAIGDGGVAAVGQQLVSRLLPGALARLEEIAARRPRAGTAFA
jgi:pimeloyl-ACP methyl ester carboxylesterase